MSLDSSPGAVMHRDSALYKLFVCVFTLLPSSLSSFLLFSLSVLEGVDKSGSK